MPNARTDPQEELRPSLTSPTALDESRNGGCDPVVGVDKAMSSYRNASITDERLQLAPPTESEVSAVVEKSSKIPIDVHAVGKPRAISVIPLNVQSAGLVAFRDSALEAVLFPFDERSFFDIDSCQ